MSINLSDTTPAAPTGGTNVKWQKDSSGNISAYITSAVEIVGAGIDATAQNANISAADLITSPTAGQYRVSAYIIVTTVASTGAATSTLPSVVITWNDKDNGQPQTITLTPTNSGNLLTTYQQADAVLSIAASAPLQYSTTGYASNTAAQMQYALHIRVEAL
jgi:hypothetical protein